MDAALFRSAFNPIIAEAHDASHGLYDAETGATLVQGKSGLPIFVGAMSFAVKTVIDKAARDGETDFSSDNAMKYPLPAQGIFPLTKPPLVSHPCFLNASRISLAVADQTPLVPMT